MKKKLKSLMKVATAIVTIGGVLYVARDQIRAIYNKITGATENEEPEDDDFDDVFDDNVFPEPSKDDRGYVSINITDENEDKNEEEGAAPEKEGKEEDKADDKESSEEK